MRARAALFVGGAAAGGALWACCEVLWLVARPFLPFEVLDRQQILPPAQLLRMVGVALPTYVALGAGLGLLLVPVLNRLWHGWETTRIFAAGAFASLTLAAITAIFVWVNLLSDGPLLQPVTLGIFALAVAIATGVAAAGAFVLVRATRSAAAAAGVCALLCIALLAGAAWVHAQLSFAAASTRAAPAEGLPNIVFVTLDTLRADYVHAYSGGPVRTPFLDTLGSQGVRFAQAFSQVPTTTPSHVSMFTSLYPFQHGAKNGVPMRPDLQTLPQLLRGQGYHTAAFVSAYTAKSNVTGLGPGFDVYVDSLNPRMAFLSRDELEPLVFYRILDRLAGNEIRAAVVNDRVRGWLESEPPRPVFLWVHFFDPHFPYDPPEDFDLYTRPEDTEDERALALYAGEVTYTDHELANLFALLARDGVLENAVVAVTADHGEAFGEPHPHVNHGHGAYLYDQAVHVPLLLWSPGRLPAGLVVEEPIESIDIAPTLLELIDVPVPTSFGGRSLLPALRGAGAADDGLAFSQTAHFFDPRFSVRSDRWKLIVAPGTSEEELFDLRSDPGETRSVASQHPEVVGRLRGRLWETLDAEAGGAELETLDRETRERLRAMGYLDDGD